MTIKINLIHERPPIPTRAYDWRAGFDGREEEGRDGFGATRFAAVIDLFQHCTDEADVLAVVAAVLREAARGDV